ncbi:MAG: VTT domain-containing protein [Chloroflexi bacterium]|nr:VTT domain-containing protein [Chloroflexota bacterium]
MTTIRPGLRFDRRLVTLLAAVTVAVALPFILQNYIRFDPEALAGAGYAVLFVVAFLSGATFFLPVPILPLVFAGASLFNPGLVALVAAAGMALGMGLTYFMGSWMREHMNWRVATRADRLGAIVRIVGLWMRRSSVLGPFILAATPNPVYDFAGVIAGSAQAPLGRFMAGIFLGKLAQTLVVAIVGFLTASRIPGLS